MDREVESAAEAIGRLKEKVDEHERRLADHHSRITALETFQRWVVGAGVVIAYILGLFSDRVKTLFTGGH